MPEACFFRAQRKIILWKSRVGSHETAHQVEKVVCGSITPQSDGEPKIKPSDLKYPRLLKTAHGKLIYIYHGSAGGNKNKYSVILRVR